MKRLFITLAIASLPITSLSLAAENVAPKAQHGAHPVKPAAASKPQPFGVDINAASKAELMKLPGIHSAEADRIIAGRPYGSKVWLISNKILPEKVYAGIQDKIWALQHVPIHKKAPSGAAK